MWEKGRLVPRSHDSLFMAMGMQYVIRLNHQFKAVLRPLLQQIVPVELQYHSDTVVGLPVRGSDKCGKPVQNGDSTQRGKSRFEAQCLPMETYMHAVQALKRMDAGIDSIVFTSEDASYIEAARNYQQPGPPEERFKLVFNTFDQTLGDSRMEVLAQSGGFDHVQMMTSLWTTLELQMAPKYYILNCNSHWHVWIYKMRAGLCGNTAPVVFCLNEQNVRSKFFMCTQGNVGENPKDLKAGLPRCAGQSAVPGRKLLYQEFHHSSTPSSAIDTDH